MRSEVSPYSYGVTEQEAVRAFMQKVYIWMAGGLALTGIIAYRVAHSEALLHAILGNQWMFFGLIIAQLALVMALSFLANRISAAVAGAMFIAYSALNGLTLSVIFLVYTSGSIAQVFFISAGMFGAMSVYGFVTKRDLTNIGGYLRMALIGIIIAMVVNIWLKNGTLDWIVSLIGVVVFVGLTAYDTQKLKNLATAHPEVGSGPSNPAILGALVLYLDFINLFLMMLRLFGKRR